MSRPSFYAKTRNQIDRILASRPWWEGVAYRLDSALFCRVSRMPYAVAKRVRWSWTAPMRKLALELWLWHSRAMTRRWYTKPIKS